MSKSRVALLVSLLGGSVIALIMWLHYLGLRDDPAYSFDMGIMVSVTAVCLAPWAFIGTMIVVTKLHDRFRAPDVVITVTARPTPLEAKFLEQDRRIERRERLKGEVFRNECEIETFAANLTPDERKAWLNRPGPFGKR